MSYLKNPYFFLILVVSTFLFREIFLAGVFPFFVGQDEARHYNTVQWLSQKQHEVCSGNPERGNLRDKDDLATYRFSEEIRETSTAANLSTWREANYRKGFYNPAQNGANESFIDESYWSKKSPCPPDIAGNADSFSLFHVTASKIENALEETDIMTRFYLIRLLSVFFGAITIILTYFIAIEAGFSRRVGLLLSITVSLQPRLSIYTTNINYDTLLIPLFTLFVYSGVRCLKRGATTRNLALLILTLGSAILTKGTSLVLFGGALFIIGWIISTKRKAWKQIPLYYWSLGAATILFIIFLLNDIFPILGILPKISLPSLFEYLGKSLPKIPSSSEGFWGTMSWNESNLGPWFVFLIWFIEAIALYGLVRYFYLKESLPFLPTKPVALFCLTLILSLQLGIRFFDWRVFQETGSLALGTPGRYFLPTLIPQLILVAIGIGALLRQKLALERVLVALAVIMLAFNFYTTWLIIIPRFYL